MNQEEHDALADMSDEDARAWLEERYGEVWNTKEVQEAFTIEGFLSPCCTAVRKSDGKRGVLFFSHNPRFYFDFR
ncbi:MAG: hypothetical protein ACTSVR_05445 [Candidatus Thorarchaeota archaeon]